MFLVERRSSDVYLLVIAAALGVAVLGLAYTRPAQTISIDSLHYLELADSLVRGLGFETEGRFFSAWPAGYPLFIVLVQTVTGLESYWASKVVNLLALLAVLWLLRRSFGSRAAVYGTALLVAQVLDLAAHSLTETVFIALLIAFALALRRYERDRRATTASWLFAAMAGLFLCRYIGLVALLPIAVMGLRHLARGDTRSFFRCLTAGLATLAVAAVYMGINYIHTGLLTGHPRTIEMSPVGPYFLHVMENLFYQANILRVRSGSESNWQQSLWALSAVFLAVAVTHVARVWRRSPAGPGDKTVWTELWPHALAIIGIYWLTIATVRWVVAFPDDPDRLFAPVSPLLLIALIDIVERRPAASLVLVRYVLIGAIASIGLNVAGKTAMDAVRGRPSFAEERAAFAEMPERAALLFADPLARYFRPDILLIKRRAKAVAQGPKAIMAKGCHGGRPSVFMEARAFIPTLHLHEAYGALMRRHPDKRFIRVGDCPG